MSTKSPEVMGVPLSLLGDPIEEALIALELRTSGRLFIPDHSSATKLEKTRENRYSAISSVPYEYQRKIVGNLAVVVFAPGDGTGSEAAYGLDEVDTGKYPDEIKVIPRLKTSTGAELYIPIGSIMIDSDDPEVVLNAGNLDLLGFAPTPLTLPYRRRLERIGVLGDDRNMFLGAMNGVKPIAAPSITLTAWGDGSDASPRHGDPHSVYNPHAKILQFGAFIALPEGHEAIDTLRDDLWPNEPTAHMVA